MKINFLIPLPTKHIYSKGRPREKQFTLCSLLSAPSPWGPEITQLLVLCWRINTLSHPTLSMVQQLLHTLWYFIHQGWALPKVLDQIGIWLHSPFTQLQIRTLLFQPAPDNHGIWIKLWWQTGSKIFHWFFSPSGLFPLLCLLHPFLFHLPWVFFPL